MEKVIVGIDLGGTNMPGAVATPGGKVLDRKRTPTQAAQGAEGVIDSMADLALDLAAGRPIAALGLGVPGLLDLKQGVCIFSGNLGWQNVPIVRPLSQKLNAPVYMDNDVRVAALGELAQGKAQGSKDFIYLAVGTGIGSGIVIDGRLLRGARWSGGESGHMVLDPQGPYCTCGSNGCLEALASATAIAREGRAAAAANDNSVLATWAQQGKDIDAAMVFKAAQSGDTSAQQVVDTAMNWLGVGVANLVNIFNPSLMVLGGGVARAGARMLDPVRRQVDRYAMPVQRQTVELTTSSLGDGAGVAGALELARQATYS